MVDAVGRPTPPQQQQPIDTGAKVGTTGGVTTGAGVSGDPNLTVENASGDVRAEGSGTSHGIDERPDPAADPGNTGAMSSLDDKAWDGTCDVFALIHRALAESAKEQNALEKDANDMETQELTKYLKAEDQLGADQKKLAHTQGIAQIVGGSLGVAGGFGGMGAAARYGDAVGGAVSGVGSSSGGVATGIGGMIEGGIQQDVTDDTKEGTLEQGAMGKSGDMRKKFGDSFGKATGAEDDVKQAQAAFYNAQASALKGS